jgi:hypothetical protein
MSGSILQHIAQDQAVRASWLSAASVRPCRFARKPQLTNTRRDLVAASRRRLSGVCQTRPFALVEPRASFASPSRPSPRQSSRRTRANAVGIRSLSVSGKNREWAGRDCAPRTQRRGWTVDGTMPRNRRMAGAGGGRTATRRATAAMAEASARPHHRDGSRTRRRQRLRMTRFF